MATSGDIALLIKFAELVQRFGLRAYEYEAVTGFVDEDNDPEGKGYCFLRMDSIPADPEKQQKVEKIKALLGVEKGIVKREQDTELEDLLDHALALAPRPRTR